MDQLIKAMSVSSAPVAVDDEMMHVDEPIRFFVHPRAMKMWHTLTSRGGGDKREKQENLVSDKASVFNAEILCEHNAFPHTRQHLELVPEAAWAVISKYFKEHCAMRVDQPACTICQAASELQMKQFEQEQALTDHFKSNLPKLLTRQRGARPSRSALLNELMMPDSQEGHPLQMELFAVPSVFVEQLRAWCKQPAKVTRPEAVILNCLKCEHGQLVDDLLEDPVVPASLGVMSDSPLVHLFGSFVIFFCFFLKKGNRKN